MKRVIVIIPKPLKMVIIITKRQDKQLPNTKSHTPGEVGVNVTVQILDVVKAKDKLKNVIHIVLQINQNAI